MAVNPILSVKELKEHRKKILAKIKKNQKAPSRLNQVAAWITDHVGSMVFFLIIFFWTLAWLGWNMFAPKSLRFDPFPGFVLWLFISNLIQLFLLPMIMIGQNVQAGHADARAEADLQINGS